MAALRSLLHDEVVSYQCNATVELRCKKLMLAMLMLHDQPGRQFAEAGCWLTGLRDANRETTNPDLTGSEMHENCSEPSKNHRYRK